MEKTNNIYKVYPDPKSIAEVKIVSKVSDLAAILSFSMLIGGIILAIFIIINLIFGGWGWIFPFATCVIIWGVLFNMSKNKDKMLAIARENEKERLAIYQAEIYSVRLNMLMTKSYEIINEILPFFESSARKSLDLSKKDFGITYLLDKM